MGERTDMIKKKGEKRNLVVMIMIVSVVVAIVITIAKRLVKA